MNNTVQFTLDPLRAEDDLLQESNWMQLRW